MITLKENTESRHVFIAAVEVVHGFILRFGRLAILCIFPRFDLLHLSEHVTKASKLKQNRLTNADLHIFC